MRDITAAAEQVYLEAIRRQEPTQRLRQALAFSEWARRLALARLAERFPERTQLELPERSRATARGRWPEARRADEQQALHLGCRT